MTAIEETITTYLQADTGLSALVGSRVYPIKLPQNCTLPAVIYSKIAGSRHLKIQGTPYSAHSRLRFDGWASTYAGAKALEAALVAAMDAYGATAAMPPVDFYEDDTETYRISVDYYIYHVEA